MLATPLVAALGQMYPEARLDWAVGEWARPAVAGNPRITELLLIEEEDLRKSSWRQIGQLVLRLRSEHYDTVFIPNDSSLLSYVAWQAGIPQRLGLSRHGSGFAHSIPVTIPTKVPNAGERGLLLAKAAEVSEAVLTRATMEFFPSDRDRTAVTRLLIEELDWLGDVPLVVLHPGGGINPIRSLPLVRWPPARYALLANHLMRAYGARVVLAGTVDERAITTEIAGMAAGKLADYTGRLSLGELGALCEVADLYVGNDTGPSHVAASGGCPTLVIFGPTNPAYSCPYTTKDNVRVLWRDLQQVEEERPFTWDVGVTVEQANAAVDEMLQRPLVGKNGLTFFTSTRV